MLALKANLNSPGDNYLLVEGRDDWHVHYHLKVANFDIGYCEGDGPLIEMLSAVVVGSGTTKKILGAVLDADADTGVEARLQSIKNRLQSAYDLPDVFPAEGLILHPRQTPPSRNRLPTIGIWLMPDNIKDGIFEDLLRKAMTPEEDQYIGHVVDQAKIDNIATFKDTAQSTERSKVIVRTYIIWQDPDKKNLGIALKPHFVNLDAACKGFFDWQCRLFQDVSGETEK